MRRETVRRWLEGDIWPDRAQVPAEGRSDPGHIRRETRAARLATRLARRQGGLCAWCRAPLAAERATLDHVIPRGLGGSSRQRNLVAACGDCNWAKGFRLEPRHLERAHPHEIARWRRRLPARIASIRRYLDRFPNCHTSQAVLAHALEWQRRLGT